MPEVSLSVALDEVTGALPRSESRPGQRRMAEAVADAIDGSHHLVVQAGTGTGKTLAYLVPVVLSRRRTVVATATKALQDQLANKDLPIVVETLEALTGRRASFAVLKGRSNYVCRQRLAEISGESTSSRRTDTAPTLIGGDALSASTRREVDRLRLWASNTRSGDKAELDWTPSIAAWSAVSVDSDQCPGARRCPLGGVCFAEFARDAAAEADVIVVNTHLYGLDIASNGAILPEHDVLILDEAHNLEDIVSGSISLSFSAGRFNAFAGIVRRILDDERLISDIIDVGRHLKDAITPHIGRRIDVEDPGSGRALPVDVFAVLARAQQVASDTSAALAVIDVKDNEDSRQRKLRAETYSGRLFEHLRLALNATEQQVAFVSQEANEAKLEIAPLDVAPVMSERVWGTRTAILTSATIPSNMPSRVGLPLDSTVGLEVESPFDYESNSILYCAKDLPAPNHPDHTAAMHDRLERLIRAAGGRTLALFTSYRAMEAAAEALRLRLDLPILTQRDLSKNEVLRRFSTSEESCLFATAGFFQGIDISGRTLSLVTIDRIPFPRPDDPLLSARRDAVGSESFREIDLPRAATLLAQATGRLIRSASDRGVVAVLDSRLATARYRQHILAALPPMRRSIDLDVVTDFLEMISRSE